ncbi:MotA/TolQ/ExbB proton channel family protein [Cognatiyoonia sp. IB215446]|nr:MotA/TolQ/ExbB proton channel family protein [Cognatiyoonia sp. IB215446]MDX8350711.1 MotA/TolQ/ExbB proton channel family protein [Cognatiyoonia sp. IB215446]
MVTSIAVLAIALYKLWQFRVAGVGRHRALMQAVQAWDAGDDSGTHAYLSRSTSYLVPVVEMALNAEQDDNDRLISEAEARFARLERGLRILDNVAQLAPLLGLFGTVLGMIEAFQALQDAGSQVDPSILAGGIWVALMTTAAGLAVAMPTSLLHSWLESRMDAERGVADQAIQTILRPRAARGAVTLQAAHA